ncbi:MAG: hypothetical protein J6C98_04670 [Oscillospiraceae bacterium]|nr:hypothetical protein [Oscillospiraceae bacterium]
MDCAELLKRIKERDMDAYLYLTNVYGLKLYNYLNSRLGDQDLVEEAFQKTLASFYESLTAQESQDPIDAILCTYADQTCGKIAGSDVGTKKKKKKHSAAANIGFAIGIVILSAGILAASWVIIGLLMDMNLIPSADLGYEWFNANIAPWF